MKRTDGIGVWRIEFENWRREVQVVKVVVEFEEENEFGMQAAGGKGGEIELGMRCEMDGMFQGTESLDRLKRVGKGSGGGIPYN